MKKLDKLEKKSTVSLKTTKSYGKLPVIACTGEVGKAIEEVVEFKTTIKDLEGKIAVRRPLIEDAGLDIIVKQIVDSGDFENIKLASESGKSLTIMLMDSYKKLKDEAEIENARSAIAEIVGEKNVDDYVGEVKTYEISEDVLTDEKAIDMLIDFADLFEKKTGKTLLNITKEIKIKKGSVRNLTKHVKKTDEVQALIQVLQPTKQIK